MHINERWYLKGRKGDAVRLAEQIGVSRRLAELLIIKLRDSPGLAEDAAEFLRPDISRMHDPLLMKDMDRAVSIIQNAAASGVKVMIVGDYDVDGIMGVLILYRILAKLFTDVAHYIPHRVDDGYGINEKIVRAAYDSGVRLIVTCDNGVSAHQSISLAKSLGIRVVVSDHHDIPLEEAGAVSEGYGVPPADAVINPKRADCAYPFKDLCGAMVAYKLADALSNAADAPFSPEERDEMLCYAAIATICDIVGLTDENRRVVHHGLKLLNGPARNAGVGALVKACGLTGKLLTSYEISHIIGPCVNAAGRLDTAELSYELFTADDPARLASIASAILELNRMRQDLTAKAYDSAVEALERGGAANDGVIVLYIPDTHESICGIVAGKLKDRCSRPAIIFTDSASGFLKGSGRSVENFDLFGCVKNAAGLVEKYGGHKMAVGVTLAGQNLERFKKIINAHCDALDESLVPKEMIDMCLNPDDITTELLNDLALLEPFGRGNEKPVFAIKNIAIEYASLVGSKRNVVKMRLRKNAGAPMEAVFFGGAGVFCEKLDITAGADGSLVGRGVPQVYIDMTFYPEMNEYNGVRRIQLVARSVRKAA